MLSREEHNILLRTSRKTLEDKLIHHMLYQINIADYSHNLTEKKASFVTLTKKGQLRGCIGNLQATRPLIKDIIENSLAAALRDPRFSQVTKTELEDITIHLSILSSSQRIDFTSEEDLLGQLIPYQDGLILKERGKSATFLPTVWESLPDPKTFLQALKYKAGLDKTYWSSSISIERYHTESFSE